MNETFPWSALGIPQDSSAEQIRRAYARKLKVTRPDENPEGFQELVNARDFALAITAQRELYATATSFHADSSNGAETVSEIESQVAPIESGKQPVLFSETFQADCTIKVSGAEPTSEQVVRTALATNPSHADIVTWQTIVEALGEVPLMQRKTLEVEIIQGLARIDLDEAFGSKEFGLVLVTLSDEYGWEHDSRVFLRVLRDFELAESLIELLYQTLAELQRGNPRPTPGVVLQLPLATKRSDKKIMRTQSQEGGSNGPVLVIVVLILLFVIRACGEMPNLGSRNYSDLPLYTPPFQMLAAQRAAAAFCASSNLTYFNKSYCDSFKRVR